MKNCAVVLGAGVTIGSGYKQRDGKLLPGDQGFFSNERVLELAKERIGLDTMLRVYAGLQKEPWTDETQKNLPPSLEAFWTFLEMAAVNRALWPSDLLLVH
jgi:hypothetical protein